jgi:hypothetical protein
MHLTGQTSRCKKSSSIRFYPQPADVGLDRLSTLTAAWLVRRQAMAEAESGSVLLIAKAALRQMLRNEL